MGDAIDDDDDNDGVRDYIDAFPLDPSESVDSDGDGIGNVLDPDDDNDGVADTDDETPFGDDQLVTVLNNDGVPELLASLALGDIAELTLILQIQRGLKFPKCLLAPLRCYSSLNPMAPTS